MQTVCERIDALESAVLELERRKRVVERRLQLWRGAAAGVTVVSLLMLSLQAGVAQGASTKLNTFLRHLLIENNGADLVITDANLHIRNGSGSTSTLNGLGNLIVGYDEAPDPATVGRGGSHNLVVGTRNSYASWGCLVAGLDNTVSGPYASVTGGQGNTAAAGDSSVSGGHGNRTLAGSSSVSGGLRNTAAREFASISGGVDNLARGPAASVSGGEANVAEGDRASVSGGSQNTASGLAAWAGGGGRNEASGEHSAAGGGDGNLANGESSSISGGLQNQSPGPSSSITGGFRNMATGTYASVPGGREIVSAGLADAMLGDHDGDGIDDGTEQALAEEYAPVIYIEPHEDNYPVNVDWFLDHASIGSQQDLIAPLLGGFIAPNFSGLNIFPDPEALSSPFYIPDLPDDARLGSLNPSDWKTYAHVYPGSSGGVVIQYWHLFAYNGLSLLGFGNHGGDWDAAIQIKLDKGLQPVMAWYSRHDHDSPGDVFPWAQLHIYQGTHPLVMIDGGGHGAYKDPQDFDNFWAGFDERHKGLFGINAPRTHPSYSWPAGGPDDPNAQGTVWRTWTGGTVEQKGNVSHDVRPNPGVSGGIVNLGEYNPGVKQVAQLLIHQFNPLNGQVFIKYSGLWGTPSSNPFGVGTPPRGPVFQGYDGNNEYYRSWYNDAVK